MKQNKFLILIILFAAVIRLVSLSYTPPSLNWDEVSHGYNAFSILKNGTDEWGVSFPTIFRAYGDYKLPVYTYTTVLSVAVFGLTEFAVRFPSAVAGIITVIFTYLLVQKLFKNKEISLFSALLVALEPWSFFVSRVALEANLALTLVVSGVYFFVSGIEKKKWQLTLSIILLGLSVWTYNSARIFVPMILVILHLLYRKQFKFNVLYVLVAILFFVPMFWQLLHPIGQARYEAVKILDQGAIAHIEEARNTTDLHTVIAKVVFNRITYFGGFVFQNYISYFSPQYLFITGGTQHQFSIPNSGILYLINIPFFVWGLILLIKGFRKREHQLLLAWFFLAPIAASVTRENQHVLRSLVMLPLPMIIIALGVVQARKYFSKYFYLVYIPLLIISFGFYAKNYLVEYRQNYSQAWQYGYKEAVLYARSKYDSYDSIVMTKRYGEPHEFVLFYNQWDPRSYLTDSNLNRFNQSNWYWVDSFDKYYFVNDWEIDSQSSNFILESGKNINCEDKKCLLIASPGNAPANWKLITTINFLDGTQAFEIYEN